jgi:hypothetical protein
MNILRLTKLTTVILSFAILPACDKPANTGTAAKEAGSAVAADPKVAFQTACDATADQINKATAEMKAGKMKEGLAAMKTISEGLSSLPVAGLPDDLQAAFKDFSGKTGDILAIMTELPEGMPLDNEKMAQWVQTAGPEALAKLQAMGPKMQALQPQVDAAKTKLETAAKAAGIDLTKFLKAGD